MPIGTLSQFISGNCTVAYSEWGSTVSISGTAPCYTSGLSHLVSEPLGQCQQQSGAQRISIVITVGGKGHLHSVVRHLKYLMVLPLITNLSSSSSTQDKTMIAIPIWKYKWDPQQNIAMVFQGHFSHTHSVSQSVSHQRVCV